MLASRACLGVGICALLTISCRVRDSGISSDRIATDAAGPSRIDGSIDGGRSGSSGGAGGAGAGGGVELDGGMGGGSGGAAAPGPDAPVEASPPACPAPMRDCNGTCIAAGACCQDSDCPAMATGKVGKCDPTSRSCEYTCGADSKPCGGQCLPQAACCDDTGCTDNLACVANSCSTTQCRSGFKRCGTACIANATCCRADGCCSHADCGACQKCASGRCVNQGGNEDLKKECSTGVCRTGTCNGGGACAATPDGQNGPSCAGECQSCKAGACEPHPGVCGMGQMCENGRCPPRPPVAVRVNVNGPQHGMFAADAGLGGVCSMLAYHTDAPINGTTDDPLFQGEMFGAPATCAVGGGNLPPGQYHVNLYFAEIYFGPTCPGGGLGVGARVFDIELEGKTVASNVDIFSEAGCAASLDGSGHPVIKRFLTTISDGTLDIRLPPHVNNGKISAIEILSAW